MHPNEWNWDTQPDLSPARAYPNGVGDEYPLGVPPEGERKMRDPENTSKMRSSTNTSSLRWVQPMVAGLVIGALVATVTFLSIKNSNDWLAPCAHVQQGACYEDSTVRENGE